MARWKIQLGCEGFQFQPSVARGPIALPTSSQRFLKASTSKPPTVGTNWPEGGRLWARYPCMNFLLASMPPCLIPSPNLLTSLCMYQNGLTILKAFLMIFAGAWPD